MAVKEQIAVLRGWSVYISHCAEHDLEITGSDYDKTADYLNSAAATLERLLAENEQLENAGNLLLKTGSHKDNLIFSLRAALEEIATIDFLNYYCGAKTIARKALNPDD